MTGLAWLCLPDLEHFRNGVVLVGLARCIAMVLIWNDLADGNLELCAMLVALNSVLQVILYTPYTFFFLRILSHTNLTVGYWHVAKNVLMFLGVPLMGGVSLRLAILRWKSRIWLETTFLPWFCPLTLISLLYTIVLMFAMQGHQLVHHLLDIVRVSVPLICYFIITFFSTLFLSWKSGFTYPDAVAQAFTSSGNNFELAIAIAISTFGIGSDEALAATIGPLVEVPVLLVFVYLSLFLSKHLFKETILLT